MKLIVVPKNHIDLRLLIDYIAVFPDDKIDDYYISEVLDTYWWEDAIPVKLYEHDKEQSKYYKLKRKDIK